MTTMRVLVKNGDGDCVALPVNDNFEAVSGLNIADNLIPDSVHAEIGHAMIKTLEHDTCISTVGSSQLHGDFVVALNLVQIFDRVAKAQQKGELAVDLTEDSGFEALVKKVKGFKP